MARSDRYHQIAVHPRIYKTLDAMRSDEAKADFRPLSMNAFCERILWDYASGKLITKEMAARMASSPWQEWQGETLGGSPVVRGKKEAHSEAHKEQNDLPKKKHPHRG